MQMDPPPASEIPELVVLDQPGPKVMKLNGPVSVGRSTSSVICVDNPNVSRTHMRFFRCEEDSRYYVEVLGKGEKACWINQEPLNQGQKKVLSFGDYVVIGRKPYGHKKPPHASFLFRQPSSARPMAVKASPPLQPESIAAAAQKAEDDLSRHAAQPKHRPQAKAAATAVAATVPETEMLPVLPTAAAATEGASPMLPETQQPGETGNAGGRPNVQQEVVSSAEQQSGLSTDLPVEAATQEERPSDAAADCSAEEHAWYAKVADAKVAPPPPPPLLPPAQGQGEGEAKETPPLQASLPPSALGQEASPPPPPPPPPLPTEEGEAASFVLQGARAKSRARSRSFARAMPRQPSSPPRPPTGAAPGKTWVCECGSSNSLENEVCAGACCERSRPPWWTTFSAPPAPPVIEIKCQSSQDWASGDQGHYRARSEARAAPSWEGQFHHGCRARSLGRAVPIWEGTRGKSEGRAPGVAHCWHRGHAQGEPWVCAACGFRNVAGNTLCGGYGKLGCKVARDAPACPMSPVHAPAAPHGVDPWQSAQLQTAQQSSQAPEQHFDGLSSGENLQKTYVGTLEHGTIAETPQSTKPATLFPGVDSAPCTPGAAPAPCTPWTSQRGLHNTDSLQQGPFEEINEDHSSGTDRSGGVCGKRSRQYCSWGDEVVQEMMNALSLDRVARDGLYKVRPWKAAEILRDACKDGNIMDASSFVTVETAGEESSDAWMRPHKRSRHGLDDEAGTAWGCSQESQGPDHLQQSQDIESLVMERQLARRRREFAKADRIRDRLKDLGVTCNDKTSEWFSSDGRKGVLPTWGGLRPTDKEVVEDQDRRLQEASPPPPPPRLSAQGEGGPSQASDTEVASHEQVLILKNLPWKAGPADVCEFLKDYGVQEPQVKILYLSDGRSDGLALVTFESIELAARANEEMQKKYLWNRFVTVRHYRGL
eukprot:TRINITY_DN898_c0_g1_i2.p1 TRINITY_DN898_c0_g1~~TRINITY_DN898_c0_g1_i2.p1  ORF type:complete len:937 (+),score=169.33 TRINITY_DN898_c0_g1_i2:78-2888(+)